MTAARATGKKAARSKGGRPSVAPNAILPMSLEGLLKRGKCVAFVGAGFSAPVGMPRWSDLLRALAKAAAAVGTSDRDLKSCIDCIDAGDLIIGASQLRKVLPEADLMGLIANEYSIRKLLSASVAVRQRMENRIRNLISGPWSGIITTNYDELIEWGYHNWNLGGAVIAVNNGAQLGTVLHQRDQDQQFFAKIHGSVTTSQIVLTSKEYDDVYLSAGMVANFMNAVMLSYTTVFIGVSLEESIQNLRRRFWVEFRGKAPLAYALLAETSENIRRVDWLREALGIQSILYKNDGTHSSVDEFLSAAFNIQDGLRSAEASASESGIIKRLSASAAWERIGRKNQEIIEEVFREGGGLISHNQLIGLEATDCWKRSIRALSNSELLYRMLFLEACGFFARRISNGQTVFVISGETQALLRSLGQE